jgi:hypothetical protein
MLNNWTASLAYLYANKGPLKSVLALSVSINSAYSLHSSHTEVAALCKIMLFHFCFDAQRHIFNSYPQP